MKTIPPCQTSNVVTSSRRAVLRFTLGAAGAGIAATSGLDLASPSEAYAAALTKQERDKLTPEQVIELLRRGNARFRTGKMEAHDYLAQKQATAGGQYPAAAILGCIDSRAPAEIIFDTRIGDTFNARVAGNVANDDLLGSLEFACAAAGAKLVLVMGHTACGAVKGAIDGVELDHLTELLSKIKPAITATVYAGERTGSNAAFVDEVAKTNVLRTVQGILRQSNVLSGLEKAGKLRVVGAMYHLVGGEVEFLR
jgi:carbonic anhydrase